MEVKAWTYHRGWKAPQCAGVIHTDFEKGFIRAEVIKYEDYIKYGSEAAVREAGKLSVEGKDYVVQDGGHHALQVQCVIKGFSLYINKYASYPQLSSRRCTDTEAGNVLLGCGLAVASLQARRRQAAPPRRLPLARREAYRITISTNP